MAERSPMIAVALITGICAIGAAVAGNMVGLLGPRIFPEIAAPVAQAPPEVTPPVTAPTDAAATPVSTTTTAPSNAAAGPAVAASPPTVSATPPRPKALMRSLQYRVNLPGNDLGAGLPVSLASECSDLCQEDDRCRAMTYVRHETGVGGVCWLKSAVSSTEPADNMTSAIKNPS